MLAYFPWNFSQNLVNLQVVFATERGVVQYEHLMDVPVVGQSVVSQGWNVVLVPPQNFRVVLDRCK